MATASPGSTPHLLMCPPDFYGIEYEINAWMKQERQVDHGLAVEQWNRLLALVTAAGARVSTLTPQPGLPDLVFTANAAFIFREEAVMSRFRHKQRRGEEVHNQRWLASHGFVINLLPTDAFFEGAGDALFCGDTLVAGYRMRSELNCIQGVAQIVGVRVIPLELIDRYYYHLDTCFCPITSGFACYYPGAFDKYGLTALRAAVPELLEVTPAEARNFACNAVVIQKTIIMNEGCDLLAAALRKRGFHVEQTPLSEFVKAGGSAKCLTLRLDGEDASAWREPS